jgi:hypothetical protein
MRDSVGIIPGDRQLHIGRGEVNGRTRLGGEC